MAEGKTALKQQALATLQAGRREISAEAQWIRNGLSPKRVVKKLAQDHTWTALLGMAAIGVAVALLIQRGSKTKTLVAAEEGEQRSFEHHREKAKKGRTSEKEADVAKPKVGMISYLAGVALKTATPFLIQSALKFAEQHLVPPPTGAAANSAAEDRNRPWA